MAKTLTDRLTALTLSQIADIYNSVAERSVSKFSDRTTAVKRTEAVLAAAGRDFTVDKDGNIKVVDLPKPKKAGRDGDDRKITVLSEANPKAKGSKSARRFGLYKSGQTVGEYIEAASKLGGGRRKAVRDINWDVAHGFIKLS